MRRLCLIIFSLIFFYGSSSAQVTKSGNIEGEIWTAEDSLYIIIGDITVTELTIEAGVIVQFEGNYKFEIAGAFQAAGFYSDSIFFQPHPKNTAGWEGIKFKSSSISSSMTYCSIEGANKDGINIDQAMPDISNCRIFSNKEDGIFLNRTTVHIQHCIVEYNALNGIEINNSQLSALNCIISKNEKSGVLSTHNNDLLNITNSVIANNKDRGIDCAGGHLTIRNSIIYYNSIQIEVQDGNTIVTYSDIQGTPIFPGTGNINAEPEFLDLSIYTLTSQSPCVDAGDPIADDSDLYFPPSLGSIRNDMGAYGGPLAFGWYPPLYIKLQSIDFYRVTQDSSKSINLDVLNYRDTGIAIPALFFEGDGSTVFSGELDNNLVLESDSVKLTVTFAPDSEKSYTSELVLQTQSHGTVSLPLQGEGVLPHINELVTDLNYDLVPVNESVTLSIPVQNTGRDTLRLQLIQPSNIVFQAEQTALTINPDLSSDTIRVTFTPDSVTTYQDSLLILTNDRDRPRIVLHLSGEGFGSLIAINPLRLNFGSIAVLSDTLLSISISNLGNNSLDIDSLILIQPDSIKETFSIVGITGAFPISVDPLRTIKFSIKFSPKDWGVLTGDLLVYSSDPLHNMVEIDLAGTGLASEMVISPSTMDFGEILIIADSTQLLNIENIGNLQLIIEDFSIIPPDSIFQLSDPIVSFPFYIDPGSSADFSLTFMPVDTGVINGQISIFSNDPYYHEVSVLLSGRGSDSGLSPSIELSSDILEFNEVDTSTYSQKSFFIYNKGPVNLIIPEDSIYIKDSSYGAFSIVNVSEEIRVDPQDSLNVVIRFRPKRLGPDQASLWISSNDTLNPQMIVNLSGTGVGDGFVPAITLSSDVLEFDQVDTNSFSLQSLFIYNLGYTDLIIPRDSIYITSSSYIAFTLVDLTNDITIIPGDSQEVVIRFEPTELGPVQANLWLISNDPHNPTMIVPLSGIGIGNGSATISFDPINSTNPLINGQAATMSFEISSFMAIDSADIFVRRGGETPFTSFSLQKQGSTSFWTADIESNLITERGMEYYVRVNQSHTLSIYPQNGESHPIAVSVQIPYRVFPEDIPAKTYQMISIPFNTPGQTLSDLFLDNLGPYNTGNYRIFECMNGFDYSEIKEMNKPLPPGESVWLITREQVKLDIQNGESVITNEPYTIELQQGWNMIATPFSFPVSWEGIESGLALRHFDGSDWPFVTIMEPFKGYAVKAFTDTTISIIANETSLPKSFSKSLSSEMSGDWHIQISALSGLLKDRFNYVGVLKSATDGIDHCDYPEPPPIGDYLSVYLVSSENEEHYSTDFRSPNAEGYIFNFELQSNVKDQKNIQMISINLPENYDWMVLNTETKVNYGRSTIFSSQYHASFKLIVGTPDFINDNSADYHSLPEKFKLAQNYPNPFNPSTTISYQLPVPCDVDLSIYNILGQKVVTLVSNNQEAGYYKIKWEGLNQSGQQVSSGLYFLHLHTKQYNHTMKIILQR